MTKGELVAAIGKLRRVGTDSTHVEAKAAQSEMPKRLWETISAFSNTRGGGTLILGVAEKEGFAVVGVSNPSRVQQDLGNLCSSMEPPVRAHIEVHQVEKKPVVVAQIPELPPASKPCYHPSAGLTNGVFVRVADGDRKLSHYEVHMLLSARGQPKEDEEAVPGSSVADLESRLVKGLLSRVRKRPGSPFSKASDESVLRSVKALVPLKNHWVCSLGGLLALGKHPQQFFPGLGLTFVAYPAAEVGAPGPQQERFLDNARVEGPIGSMLPLILSALRRNMKSRSIVRGLFREDVDEYPVTAIREALINALAHRDLSSGSRGTPVQVQMFSDRLMVMNPGGLFGTVTLDLLGKEGISSPRNVTLLRLLEDVTPAGERQAVCENRGSGVGAMLAALKSAGLPKAAFEDRISSFRVTFFGRALLEEVTKVGIRRRDRRQEILDLLSKKADLSRAEISQELGLPDAIVRRWMTVLREERKVKFTAGQRARSKNVRYRMVKK